MCREVVTSAARIADHNIQRLFFSWRFALTADGADHATQVCCHSSCILITKTDIGHSLRLTRPLNDRDDHFSVLIAKPRLRTEKVGAAHVAPAQVRSVAGLAVNSIECLTVSHCRRIFGCTWLAGIERTRCLSSHCYKRHWRVPTYNSQGSAQKCCTYGKKTESDIDHSLMQQGTAKHASLFEFVDFRT